MTDGTQDLVGQRVLMLAEAGVAAICCHTNWDSAQGGVNYVLAKLCGLDNLQVLEQGGVDARACPLAVSPDRDPLMPVPMSDYLQLLKGSWSPTGCAMWMQADVV